jgi:hypothetical protein
VFPDTHGARRRGIIAVTATTAAAALAVSAPVATAIKAKKPGKKVRPAISLCAWGNASGALSAAEVSGGCHETRGRSKTRHTPFGTVGVAVYTAKWGTSTGLLVPQHTLVVSALRETGSGEAAKYIEKQARLKVIEEGSPVGSPGGKVTASWNGDTYSCENPPTGDCTKSEFQAAKGRWVVGAGLLGAPAGTPGAEENAAEQNEDDPQDLQQEEALKGPVVSIGLYIAARL